MDALQLIPNKKYLFRNNTICLILNYLWPSQSLLVGDYQFRIIKNLNDPNDTDLHEKVHLTTNEIKKHIFEIESEKIINNISDLYDSK